MEARRSPPPEYTLSLFADPTTITPLIKGILHTIFFHRYFPTIRPSTHELLHLTLPYVDDPDLASLIDTRAAHLARQLSSTTSPNNSVRGNIGVQFFEKRRRKSTAGFGGVGGVGMAWFGVRGNGGGNGAEEEVCWEIWRLEVTLAMPRTQEERNKVMRAMETSLQKTAMKIVAIANGNKDHIPPITTSDSNPFPYLITLNPKLKAGG